MLADREGQGLYPDYDRYTIYRGQETSALLTSIAQRFREAPACRAASDEVSASRPSPFVSVLRPR